MRNCLKLNFCIFLFFVILSNFFFLCKYFVFFLSFEDFYIHRINSLEHIKPKDKVFLKLCGEYYGVGSFYMEKLAVLSGVKYTANFSELSEKKKSFLLERLNLIFKLVNRKKELSNALRVEVFLKSRKYLRKKKKFPANGQRTRSNASTSNRLNATKVL